MIHGAFECHNDDVWSLYRQNFVFSVSSAPKVDLPGVVGLICMFFAQV